MLNVWLQHLEEHKFPRRLWNRRARAVVTTKLCCRWVTALRLLVGIVKSEQKAALAVWPAGSAESDGAFIEVVSRSVVAATHAGAFIVASKRTPEKVRPGFSGGLGAVRSAVLPLHASE